MRFAIISDIHANAVALRAVAADIGRLNVEQVVCLGDVLTLGPDVDGVIAILNELGCSFVLGNHDEFLLRPQSIDRYTDLPMIRDSIEYTRKNLSSSHLRFLEGFQDRIQYNVFGKDVLFYHGTPRSNIEACLASAEGSFFDELLRQFPADVYVGGHTHVSMFLRKGNACFLNPGSVGLPFAEYRENSPPQVLSFAEYAILDIDEAQTTSWIRRIPLDRQLLASAAGAWANPLATALQMQYQD